MRIETTRLKFEISFDVFSPKKIRMSDRFWLILVSYLLREGFKKENLRWKERLNIGMMDFKLGIKNVRILRRS